MVSYVKACAGIEYDDVRNAYRAPENMVENTFKATNGSRRTAALMALSPLVN